jgi:hypothetical protein
MIQYDDRHFSDIMPMDKAFAELTKCLEDNTPIQALHIGTPAELENRKRELLKFSDVNLEIRTIKADLAKLQYSVNAKCPICEWEAQQLLIKPTQQEIKEFTTDVVQNMKRRSR